MSRPPSFTRIACTGKQAFAGWHSANRILRRMHRQKRAQKKPALRASIYRCQACGLWHIGGRYD